MNKRYNIEELNQQKLVLDQVFHYIKKIAQEASLIEQKPVETPVIVPDWKIEFEKSCETMNALEQDDKIRLKAAILNMKLSYNKSPDLNKQKN